MFERLMAKGHRIAERKARFYRASLAQIDLPQGVTAARSDTGIVIAGKRLRLRMITDARLRSFADLVRRIMR